MKEEKLIQIREIVAEILERKPEDLTFEGHLINDHGADSMRTIEILDSIERAFDIEIPQEKSGELTSVTAIYDVVNEIAGWE